MTMLSRRALLGATTVGVMLPGLSRAADQPFGPWLEAVRREALAEGISPAILDAALTGIEPIERVIELDRRQPEGRWTHAEYLERVVPASRIDQGRRLLAEHRALLTPVAARYGVQPRFIVALWGIETSYGGHTGGFSVINALATLAWDGRRSTFFRAELMNALRILDEGHIAPADMKGSWAGAMGQSQFMPSSFNAYAVDFDGDGRRDIWNSLPDVFGSAANYLKSHGWNGSWTWGREVRVPGGLDESLFDLDVERDLGWWQERGVRRLNGADLPGVRLNASLIRPDGPGGRAFLVYDNFRVIMRWNRSTYFATAVGLLSDAIAGIG